MNHIRKERSLNQSLPDPSLQLVETDLHILGGNPKRWDTTKLGIAQNQGSTWDLCYGNWQTIKFATEDGQDPTHYVTQEEYPLIYQDLIDHR